MDTRTLFQRMCPSGLRTIWVAGNGVDTNAGTMTSPYRTIQKAVDVCQPGDRILCKDGVYDYFQFYGKNGSSFGWITVEAAPGAAAIIDVSHSVAAYDAAKQNNGADFQVSSYIGLYGFEIFGDQGSSDTNPSGVGIFRGSTNIKVMGCRIHDFPGGGVNCFYIGSSTYQGQTLPGGGWDAVDVWFNEIWRTSKYNPFNTSAISGYGAESLAPLLDGRYGYRYVGNFIHDVICLVPYTPGGFTDVTDGNGISPDSLAVANSLYPSLVPYLKRGLVEANLVMACGGPGVKIYNAKNIDVWFNTLIGNLRSPSPYMAGYADIAVALDTADANNGVDLYGNVTLPFHTNKVFDTTAQFSNYNVALGGTDAVTGTNINARAQGAAWFKKAPTEAALLAGALKATDFGPAAKGAAVHKAYATGFTPDGGRTGDPWTHGALEPVLAARPFR